MESQGPGESTPPSSTRSLGPAAASPLDSPVIPPSAIPAVESRDVRSPPRKQQWRNRSDDDSAPKDAAAPAPVDASATEPQATDANDTPLFFRALPRLYEDKDGIFLLPEDFAALVPVSREARDVLGDGKDVWTELARTPSYVMRLASVLHTEPMRAIHEDEKPSRQPLHWETVFAGPATQPLRGALMREMILRELNDSRFKAADILPQYDETYYWGGGYEKPEPTEEEWDAATGKDWAVVAGSYALHEHLMRTSKKPNWQPNDIDIWVTQEGLKVYRFVHHLENALQGLGINLVRIRPNKKEEAEGDVYGRASIEDRHCQYFPTDPSKDTRSDSGICITEVHDFLYCVDDPALADAENVCMHLLNDRDGIDVDKAISYYFDQTGRGSTPRGGRARVSGFGWSHKIDHEERWKAALRAAGDDRQYEKLSIIGVKAYENPLEVCRYNDEQAYKLYHQKGAIDPYDIIQRFDLNICQVAMVVDPCTGEKIFIYGEYVEKTLAQHVASPKLLYHHWPEVLYHNSLRLPDRVEKYKARGFRFGSYWEREWNEWFEMQPESKEDSSYWDDESDDEEVRVRTHPLLDAARARWAREEEPRRAALDLAARRREEAQIERRIAAGRAMERRREERRRAREDLSSRADPWSPGGSLADP